MAKKAPPPKPKAAMKMQSKLAMNSMAAMAKRSGKRGK